MIVVKTPSIYASRLSLRRFVGGTIEEEVNVI